MAVPSAVWMAEIDNDLDALAIAIDYTMKYIFTVDSITKIMVTIAPIVNQNPKRFCVGKALNIYPRQLH
ncbi:MAG: hypothetical protein JNJ85_13055 [Candidatus Kapabacteria bacterium]|nr:hypothetical protein [Candidatus Kapabacteria bacterium]